MRKLLITLLIFINFCTSATSVVNNNLDGESFDDVINAIMYIESKHNANAVSKDGKCVGIMQMQKVVVDDCNEYLRMKGVNKTYSYNDRLDKGKSIEMFFLIQERYKNYKRNRSKTDVEHMIRLWNGGCNYTVAKTEKYYRNVMNVLKDFSESEIDI